MNSPIKLLILTAAILSTACIRPMDEQTVAPEHLSNARTADSEPGVVVIDAEGRILAKKSRVSVGTAYLRSPHLLMEPYRGKPLTECGDGATTVATPDSKLPRPTECESIIPATNLYLPAD
jgi:hypothetical protein